MKSITTELATEFGILNMHTWNQRQGKETVALSTQNLDVTKPILVRIHSECLTGDTFNSLHCDCGQQKYEALQMITKSNNGVFIYHRAEGRGIGLFEKIKAYKLQKERGLNTYEANLALGYGADERDYTSLKMVFDKLKITKIKLLTNNPLKIKGIEKLGIKIVESVPLIVKSNFYNRDYIRTKMENFEKIWDMPKRNMPLQ